MPKTRLAALEDRYGHLIGVCKNCGAYYHVHFVCGDCHVDASYEGWEEGLRFNKRKKRYEPAE